MIYQETCSCGATFKFDDPDGVWDHLAVNEFIDDWRDNHKHVNPATPDYSHLFQRLAEGGNTNKANTWYDTCGCNPANGGSGICGCIMGNTKIIS